MIKTNLVLILKRASNNLNRTNDDYLFINKSDCDDKAETEFDEVYEDIDGRRF